MPEVEIEMDTPTNERDQEDAPALQGENAILPPTGIQVTENQPFSLGDYAKSIIYGGLDGIMTTFAIVSSVHAAQLHPVIALILGVANLFADACSMGTGDYLSDTGDQDLANHEVKKIRELMLDGTKLENKMLKLYAEKQQQIGQRPIDISDVRLIIAALGKDEGLLARYILSLQEKEKSKSNAAKNGLATFFSFLFFGFGPLLTYVITTPANSSRVNTTFVISISITLLMLSILGAIAAHITHAPFKLSATRNVLLSGIFVGMVSYGVGYTLSQLIGQNQ